MPATWPSPPPTRILSWQQMVREADPNYTRLSLQPWVYQFSSGRLFVDPLPLYDFADIGEGLGNNGGVLYLEDATGWPTNGYGLSGGQLFSNGGEPTIVGGAPIIGSPLLILFGQISSAILLTTPVQNLPWVSPEVGSGYLWNPGGIDGGPIYIA